MCTSYLNEAELARLREAEHWMTNHLHARIRLQGMARRAALEKRKFMKAFQLVYGCSFQQYLLQARLQLADLLLRETPYSLKEIGILCGYPRRSNFITAYKKYFGATPGSRRKKAATGAIKGWDF